MALKPQIEAIIYAAEEPVPLEQLTLVLRDTVIAESALADAGLEPKALDAEIKSRVRAALEELAADYANSDRGMELRQVAGGWRMGTKPEHHDLVRQFVKSLKPPMRLSLPALETLSVIAYKQPITVPEISEIRGVDSGGVIATLLDRKLITTAGRKQVVGRPILYKTSKEFLLRFGLKDVSELPSLEEFEKLAESQGDLFETDAARESSPAEPAVEAPANATEPVPEQDEVPQGAAEPASPAAEPVPDAGEPAACETPRCEQEAPSISPGDESSQSAEPVPEFPQ